MTFKPLVKRSGVAILILIALLYVASLIAAEWGRRSLRAYGEIWKNDVAAERARVAERRLPVLQGPPLDENAAARYTTILEQLDPGEIKPLFTAAKVLAGTLPPETSAVLAKHRGEIQEIEKALRCTRCDWATKFEQGYDAPQPSFLGLRFLVNLLLVDARERVASGDVRGGVMRCLETIRLTTDDGTSGIFFQVICAVADQRRALVELGQLVATGRPEVPLDEIENALAELEPYAPTIADAFRAERLLLGGSMTQPLGDHPAVLARGANEVDSVLREAERAASTNDPADRARVSQRVKGESSWSNPIAAGVLSTPDALILEGAELRAMYRLVRTAVVLEKAFRATGQFPESQELSLDPCCAPSGHLHYRRASEGMGYTLWSVGKNGRDDGGQSGSVEKDDLVIEHAPGPDRK